MFLNPGLEGTYFMCDARGPRARSLSPTTQLKRCVVLRTGDNRFEAFTVPNWELTEIVLPVISLGDIVEIEGQKYLVECGLHAPRLKETQ